MKRLGPLPLGTHHLRLAFPIPSEFKGFPEYLRAAGYYCSKLERILAAAKLVGDRNAVPEQVRLLADPESAVRYWAAVGLRAAGKEAAPARAELKRVLNDASPCVRIEAAAALAQLGDADAALATIVKELQSEQSDTRMHAARTLQLLGEAARPALPAMKQTLAEAGDGANIPHHLRYVRFSLKPAVLKLEQQPHHD